MHYNIFVKLLFASILACLTFSCATKIEIDEPAGRVVSVAPSTDGYINLTLLCKSNLNDYIKVNYEFIDCDQIRHSGNFSASDSLSFYWEPDTTQLKLAFKAERLLSFSAVIFDRPEGIDFNVKAILTTPTDGVELNWGALYGASYTYMQSLTLWHDTVTALNSGLPEQTPGTGTTRYLLIGIAPDSHGQYGISLDWVAGNLFDK